MIMHDLEHTLEAKASPTAANAERRAFLRNGGLFLSVLTVGAVMASRQARPMMACSARLRCITKAPHNGQMCSDCAYFIPGSSATATGTCRLVDGTIYPNGWCEKFSS
jgi:High potential iron-sulfur protein.